VASKGGLIRGLGFFLPFIVSFYLFNLIKKNKIKIRKGTDRTDRFFLKKLEKIKS